MTRLAGAALDFVLNYIPYISGLMVHCIDAVLDHAKTVVIGNKEPDSRACPNGCATTSSGGFRTDYQ